LKHAWGRQLGSRLQLDTRSWNTAPSSRLRSSIGVVKGSSSVCMTMYILPLSYILPCYLCLIYYLCLHYLCRYAFVLMSSAHPNKGCTIGSPGLVGTARQENHERLHRQTSEIVNGQLPWARTSVYFVLVLMSLCSHLVSGLKSYCYHC
jgi:hypothetical protein